MTAITDILKQVPIDQLAQQLGASKKDTKTASTQAITSLLAGLTSNATDSQGEQSLAGALIQHLASGQSFASDGVNLDNIDTKDGAKIVQHALGTDTAKAAAAVAAKTGTDQSLLQKLLPILAPVVVAYLATKFFKGQSTPTTGNATDSGGSDVLGGLVGSLLGGGSQQSSGGGLGDIVGGLLGGGSQSSGGGLGNIVGGLLGGGSQSSGALSGMLGGLLGDALGGDKTKATQAQQSSGGILGGLLDSIF